MKKFLQNVVWRSLFVLAFGVLLLAFSGDMSRWIVYASGGLFFILGTIVLVGCLRNKAARQRLAIYPVVAVGSVLFGLVQLIFPDLFFGVLRYLLGAIVCVLTCVQLYSLVVVRKAGVPLHWVYFLLPVVATTAAVVVMMYKGFVENDPRMMMAYGVILVFYALLELWTVVLVKRYRREMEEEVPLAEIEQ